MLAPHWLLAGGTAGGRMEMQPLCGDLEREYDGGGVVQEPAGAGTRTMKQDWSEVLTTGCQYCAEIDQETALAI